MKTSITSTSLIFAILPIATSVLAQNVTMVVNYGAVVIMRTGDRQPLLYQNPSGQLLSSIGAEQAYENGRTFQARYMPTAAGNLNGSSAPIKNLPFYYDPSLVSIIAGKTPDLFASAQAFMQGLYPPTTWNSTNLQLGQYSLLYASSGNLTQYPENGYQYPVIEVPSDRDDDSIVIDGSNGCMTWRDMRNEYLVSNKFENTRSATREFYEQVGAILQDDHVSYDQYDYAAAPYIAEYVNYQYTHNKTVFNLLTEGTLNEIKALQRLQWLADEYNFNLYASPTIDPSANYKQISTIAGQTMAGRVLDQLTFNKNTAGNSSMLSLIVSDFEPFMGFFQVSGLAALDNDFTGMPDYGSAMAFELYSNSALIDQVSTNEWPPDDQLMVRFLFSNGSTGGLMDFPLFQEASASIPWPVFQDHMTKVMVESASDWCNDCNSQLTSDFCRLDNYTTIGGILGSPYGSSPSNSNSNNGLTTTTAGVIGAVATLIVVGLFLILMMACFGMRFSRMTPERKDDLRGFRGSQKLASDPDLTIAKGGNRMFVSETEPKPRVGSWELKDGQGIQRPANLRSPPTDDEDRFHHFGASIQPVERV